MTDIKTDNSAVIATLQARVVELEKHLKFLLSQADNFVIDHCADRVEEINNLLATPITTDTLDALIEQRISERLMELFAPKKERE